MTAKTITPGRTRERTVQVAAMLLGAFVGLGGGSAFGSEAHARWAEAHAQRAEPPTPPPERDAPTGREHDLVVHVQGVDEARLLDELRLRLPGRTIVDDRGARPPEGYAYAIVGVDDDGRTHLTLVEPTGDAYDRTLEPEPDQSVRVLASALASLVDSVESESVAPTRRDVEIPPPPPPPDPVDATPVPAPTPTPVPAVRQPVASPSADPPPPRFEIGPLLAVTPVIGVAPPSSASAFAAAGAETGLRLRSHRGVAASFGVRMTGRSARDLEVLRLRIAAGAGYVWRRGAFELPIDAAITIEPWWLRRDGNAAPLLRESAAIDRLPLLGALARVAPGLRVPVGSRGVSLRVGAWIELAGSFVPDSGARTIEIGIADSTGTRTPALRVGGFELASGLEVGLWLPIRPR